MKNLLLLRHAQASGTSLNDSLTSLGFAESEKLGKILLYEHIKVDFVICSEAVRAKQTYDHVFADMIKKPKLQLDKRIYHALSTDLLGIVHNVDNNINNLMIIGHNPAISALLTKFEINHDEANYELYIKALNTIPTCKLVCLSFPKNSSWLKIQDYKPALQHVFIPEKL